MNLLVTGGAGFIGSNFIRHIIDRPEVTRLVNLDCLTYAGHLANLESISGHAKYTNARFRGGRAQSRRPVSAGRRVWT
jgi:dTDP-glucose 4,6-dehydratase